MQKCKVFEAKFETDLEEEYNKWAAELPSSTEVTHMNTFVKEGWYKMIILYR